MQGGWRQFQPPGLDLRQIEQVVDQRQQVFPALADDVQALAHLVVSGQFLAPSQDLDVAQDAVQGGAQFVAHVRQEGAFRLVGGGRFLRQSLRFIP